MTGCGRTCRQRKSGSRMLRLPSVAGVESQQESACGAFVDLDAPAAEFDKGSGQARSTGSMPARRRTSVRHADVFRHGRRHTAAGRICRWASGPWRHRCRCEHAPPHSVAGARRRGRADRGQIADARRLAADRARALQRACYPLIVSPPGSSRCHLSGGGRNRVRNGSFRIASC
jgi:hypothetical protein